VPVREKKDGKWREASKIDIRHVPSLPGLPLERGGSDPLLIEVGRLPSDKLFYRDRGQDRYLTMEELSLRPRPAFASPAVGISGIEGLRGSHTRHFTPKYPKHGILNHAAPSYH
jgi:hypothetical protein